MTREEKARFCIDSPKKSPAFQFYPDNWFGSRHVSAMSAKQRGIHATLIFAAWLEPSCGVPEGEECITARVQESDIEECKVVLKYCWFLFEGFWFNERLLNERIKQIDISKTRTEVGLMGGRPKKSRCYKKKPIGKQTITKAKANETKSVIEDEEEKEEEKRKERLVKINTVHRECSLLLKSRIQEKRKAVIDDLKLLKWDNVVRLMIEKDKYTQKEIIDTINACHDMQPNRGGFTWADNILSMATLREKMKEGKIYPEMNKNNDFGNRSQTAQKQFGRKELTKEAFINQMSFLKDDPRP